jgi:hypothetical protein
VAVIISFGSLYINLEFSGKVANDCWRQKVAFCFRF